MKLKRRESRETAFSLIFEWSFREEESLGDVIAQAEAGRGIVVDEFAYDLAEKTIGNCGQLDKSIEKYSTKWKLNRIPRVTLTALRMSFCEMSLFEGIPVGATINEAVELVKKYATEEDASYLNGILGQYNRDRDARPGAEADKPEADTRKKEEQEQLEILVMDQSIQAGERTAVEDSLKEEALPGVE